MIVVGDTFQVFSFCPVADVGVDVPAITLVWIKESSPNPFTIIEYWLYSSLVIGVSGSTMRTSSQVKP
jgi:hypothetical protein